MRIARREKMSGNPNINFVREFDGITGEEFDWVIMGTSRYSHKLTFDDALAGYKQLQSVLVDAGVLKKSPVKKPPAKSG